MEFSTGLTQIGEIIDDSLTQAAQRLAQSGAVSDVRVLQAGAVVTGIAAAEPHSALPHSRAHRVSIRRRSTGLDSECSCGERAPCVHAAAVLIVAEQDARRISEENRVPGSKPYRHNRRA